MLSIKKDIYNKLDKQYINDIRYQRTIINYLKQITVTKFTILPVFIDYHSKKLNKILQNLQTQHHEPNESIKNFQLSVINSRDELTNEEMTISPNSNETAIVELELELMFKLTKINPYNLSKELNPMSKMKYNYIFLDTNNCHDKLENSTKFKWLVNDNNSIAKPGFVNVNFNMRNIKAARFKNVMFTDVSNMVLDVVSSGQRIAVNFEEFSSQSLITPYGYRFQFLLSNPTVINARSISISTDVQNQGWFKFANNYLHLNTLTLNMFNFLGYSSNIDRLKNSFYGLQYWGNNTSGLATYTGEIITANNTLYIYENSEYVLDPDDVFELYGIVPNTNATFRIISKLTNYTGRLYETPIPNTDDPLTVSNFTGVLVYTILMKFLYNTKVISPSYTNIDITNNAITFIGNLYWNQSVTFIKTNNINTFTGTIYDPQTINNPLIINNYSIYFYDIDSINLGQYNYNNGIYAEVDTLEDFIVTGINPYTLEPFTYEGKLHRISQKYFQSPITITPGDPTITQVTITYTRNPRMTAVLELISEDDGD